MSFCVLLITLLSVLSVSAKADDEMTLEQFLVDAQGQNLSLKAEGASALAAKEGAAGIAIPPPMVGVTQMRDDSGQATNFEVIQTIPFPTKISSEHSARQLEADSKSAMLSARGREVSAQAKLIYFKLWKTQERIRLLLDKKAAIEQHLKLARAATRSDSFLKIHLIKSESDLDLMENEILQAEQDKRERQIQAAIFLNRDPKTFKVVAREFSLSKLPEERSLEKPNQLEVMRFDLEALKARESEARSSWFPEFNLRYREMGGTTMTPRYSEVMVGASLPFIFFWEPKAASGKAAAERAQGEYLLEQERRRIQSEQATLFTRAESLKKQLDQFKDKLLPRAEQRVRLVHNVAPRDMETLQDHRETMEALPELKLKALEVRDQYEEAVAELEKYISGDQQ
jgi:outer membrane protein TolC